MQTLVPRTNRFWYSLGITIALLVVWLIPPANDWFRAFVKLEPMRLPYTVTFFVLLFCLLFGLGHQVSKKSLPIAITLGAVFGQLAAFVAIFLANLFISDGIGRTTKTIGREGIGDVLATDFVVALILGGWLIAAVAFAALKLLFRSANPKAPSST